MSDIGNTKPPSPFLKGLDGFADFSGFKNAVHARRRRKISGDVF
jgi:hypothetical protein